jgi:hypothetical protein
MDSPFAPTQPSKALPVTNLVCFVAVIVINAISSAGAISKYGVGDVSDMYQTLITPAGYAFSIWGIIYFAVAVFIIWQLIPSVRDDHIVFDRIGWWFAISCVFNCLWIICFVQATPIIWIWVSTVLLFLIFGSLLMLITRVGVWRRAFAVSSQQSVGTTNFTYMDDGRPTPSAAAPESVTAPPSVWRSLLSYFSVDFAFSIYCAWTTVASILNVSLSLVGSGFTGGAEMDRWAIAILVVAAVIFLLMVGLPEKQNWAYGFVFTWAAMAISKKDAALGCTNVTGSTNMDPAGCQRVQHTAIALAAIVGVASVLQLLNYCRQLWVTRANNAAASESQLQIDVDNASVNQAGSAS